MKILNDFAYTVKPDQHKHTHTDSCHSNQEPVHLCLPPGHSQALLCQKPYVATLNPLTVSPPGAPWLAPCLRPLSLVALWTWSLMSLRQLTDAVTAPEHNRAHDKHVVTRTYNRSSADMLAQGTRLRCAGHGFSVLDNKLLQPLVSVYFLIFQQPQKVRSIQELTVMKISEQNDFRGFFFPPQWSVCHILSAQHIRIVARGSRFTKLEIFHTW